MKVGIDLEAAAPSREEHSKKREGRTLLHVWAERVTDAF
jgi:hypothetical protein